MPNRGKKYIESRKSINAGEYDGFEAVVKMTLESSYAKFDETIDVAVRLGVDPRHADQMVRGSVILPNGTGKEVKVLVFAKGEKEKEALDAGAEFVGNDDLVEKIKDGWFGFDKTVATPDMMGTVGKIGKLLGPRSLMPNPKVGTVTFEVARAVNEAKSGKVEYRVEKAGIVHAPVGKVSFDAEKLKGNLITLMDALFKAKPSTAKGTYVKKVTISATMGPGVNIDIPELQALAK